jgi:hypothetical protein
MSTPLIKAWARWQRLVKGNTAAKMVESDNVQMVGKMVEEWAAPLLERPSTNMVRMAKAFFQWASNAWWTKELLMQHERFVVLLQQREASKLSAKWEPVMLSPHQYRVRTSSPPSQKNANIAQRDLEFRQTSSATYSNNSNTSQVEQGGAMWNHVFHGRSRSPQKHRIPTAASLPASPSKSPSLTRSGSKKLHTPERLCRTDPRGSPTRIFQHSHVREY